MDLYSTTATNKIPQIILVFVQVVLIAVSFLILFFFNKNYHFFSTRAYELSLYAILLFNCLTFIRILFSSFIFMKRKMPADEVVSVSLAFGLYYIGFPFFTVFSSGHSLPLMLSGAGLFLLGSFIHVLSELQRHLWKKKPEHKGHLYTKGLFGVSRHPNYFGDCLWVLGYAVVSANWWAFLVPVLLFFFFLFYNIPLQEKHLAEKYKDEFAAYRKKVKRLVPFLL